MAKKTIQPDQSGTGAIRRVARGFIEKAAGRLATAQLSDKDVHEARKDLQRSRAALRLLRPAVGRRIYRRENRVLRDAAQALNAARDAKILGQALEALRHGDRALLHDSAAAQLSRVLHAEQAQIQRELRANAASLAAPRARLEQASRRSDRWRVGKHGWSMLGPAFKRIYKSGRRAMPAARSRPNDAVLHEWRKQVKYLRFALQMLAPMQPRALTVLVKKARSLSERLGKGHDLALLAQKAQDFGRGNQISVAALLGVIDRHRSRLNARALASGGQLYRPKPRVLTRRLEEYWNTWQRRKARNGT